MKLCRASKDFWIAGICGGLAQFLGWSSRRLRIVWVVAIVFGGTGILFYLALWFLMPKAPPESENFEPALLQPWKKPE